MQINSISTGIKPYNNGAYQKNADRLAVQASPINNSYKNADAYCEYIANINKVSFGNGEYNSSPLKKLYWVTNGSDHIYEDEYTKSNYFYGKDGSQKRWVNAPAYHLLNRSTEDAIRSILTIANKHEIGFFETPKYGNNWGRSANYIEINPRTIACHEGDRVKEGLLSCIKLLPAIPPSGNNFANCVVLSQLYPTTWSDGYTDSGASLYTMNLKEGLSKNLTSDWLERDGVRVHEDELAIAFNDLAHLRGLKTGFRMHLSENQMKVNGQPFNWDWHQEDFIEACCKGIRLGFDAIYMDSAKHIDGHEEWNYFGQGRTPNYKQMQYINQQIRDRTKREDISIVGEKCNKDPRHENLGFSVGTDWSNASSRGNVVEESNSQKWNSNYAAGPEVSNDNDEGEISFEERLNKIDNCLFGYECPSDKLPSYMQMHDIFPLSPYTNTHYEMENSHSKSNDGSPQSHYWNVFNTSDSARQYQEEVNRKFAHAIEM